MWLFQPLPAAGQQDAAGPVTVAVPLGTLVVTGQTPTVTASDHKTVSVPLGTLTLTANAPTVTAGGNVSVDVPLGALVLTGNAPTVTATAHQSIAVPLAELTLAGFAPEVEVSGEEEPAPAPVPQVGGGRGSFRIHYGPPIIEVDDVEYTVETEAEARRVIKAVKRKAIRQIHRAERFHELPAVPTIVVKGATEWLTDLKADLDDDLDEAFAAARQALEDEDDIEALLI
jgi:hypothetical protein